MNKIIFKISKNNLTVSIYKKDNIKEDLNNTNVINTKEIYFSSDYISENLELVSSFLNVVIIKQNVNKIIIKDYEIIPITLDIINQIPSIKELYLKPDKVISYEMFIKILDNKYLTDINAFDIPKYLLERLDINKDLNITLRCEILFISNFMQSNNLITYSDIYYKKNIIINKNFNETDINDFIIFLNINKYLKIIEFSYFNKDLLVYVLKNLLNISINNVKIIFNQEYINIDEIFKPVNDYINKNEKVLKEHNITFKINYSEKYKKDNMFKQINLNFIKISLIATILVVSFMLSINIYRNYKDKENYETIEEDINSIIKIKSQVNEEINNNEPEYITPNENDKARINETTLNVTTSTYDIKYQMIFNELLKINNDTVGWLKVNNTNIDYPVVTSTNNEYYLKRDYYKNSNRHGWIFMDYRNNINNLSRNTIIYGHNLANQKMFGTLRYALNSNWYKKTSNQVITFNTLNQNMNWQIFSIYKVPVTSDYLRTEFGSNTDYLEFINLIKSRSIYDFGINVNTDDKILTLSTCSNGHDQRLVIHAKLIKN